MEIFSLRSCGRNSREVEKKLLAEFAAHGMTDTVSATNVSIGKNCAVPCALHWPLAVACGVSTCVLTDSDRLPVVAVADVRAVNPDAVPTLRNPCVARMSFDLPLSLGPQYEM
jgi:hypothetical protein